ncbi:MltA domain-containing protein [Candidatus Deianiraea vastatrix]|uniref:peptidoglycan lytic exotransglycosylase n=1 Tax=Candidatus Deianiraea vastatrix TaxID=2163644 RepID=A0A5B8XKM8_9RICK|nr:MltA domain-containing protein [Candidatus Deianiraea vastatrix]QED23917.1 Membrane-bound lytic murein transglycosylase A precursor [Candidatus Deianiraea vastatrix]
MFYLFTRFTIVLTLLFTSGCAMQFGRYDGRKKYKSVKYDSVADIFQRGKKVEYVDFKDWKNEYLNDIKFDIFLDSNGSRIGILNNNAKDKGKFTNVLQYKTRVKDLNLTMFNLESKIDEFWSDNVDVNEIFVSLQKRVIQDVVDIKGDEIIENAEIQSDSKDFIDYINERDGKISEKTIGSNNSVRLVIKKFKTLDGIENDENISDAIISFSKSCDSFLARPDKPVETRNIYLGLAKDWHEVCNELKKFVNKTLNKDDALKYFISNFTPIQVYQRKSGGYDPHGSFTGYYELDLAGDATKSGKYKFPIYAMPPECASKQCPTRSEINEGKLSGRGLELYWAKNPLDIFLLQIQGSGIVALEDGTFGRVGFAGTNKQRGKNIFTYMKNKCIPKCNPNLNEIIAWFEENPEEGNDVLAHTDSYVFFRKLSNNGDGAIGAQGVSLTPSRSVAVDNGIIPYGAPLWMQTYIAVKNMNENYIRMSRMVIAQDTGEAIRGAVRADIFWGHGTKARYLAEKQKFPGVYFMMIPNNVLHKVRVK